MREVARSGNTLKTVSSQVATFSAGSWARSGSLNDPARCPREPAPDYYGRKVSHPNAACNTESPNAPGTGLCLLQHQSAVDRDGPLRARNRPDDNQPPRSTSTMRQLLRAERISTSCAFDA